MNKLDVTAINSHSPYYVEYYGDALRFVSDYDVNFSVTFDDDNNSFFTVYWFNGRIAGSKGEIVFALVQWCQAA